MSDVDLRIDPLTDAYVVVTPWRQQRPNRPGGQCPFCPGGLEAPEPYDVRHFPNRWPALPDGTRRYSRRDIDRLEQICALTADGLNLAGIRRVLQLQEETRQLQAELATLRDPAAGTAARTPKEP